jgi:glycosyltransferase involved in cell wall biosynthesis
MRSIGVIYLGRSGAGPLLTREINSALTENGYTTYTVLSSFNKESLISESNRLDIKTYESVIQLILKILLLPIDIIKILRHLKSGSVKHVVFVMNTPYSILVQIILMIKGVKCIPIIHDAVRHPGDPFYLITKIFTFFEVKICYKIIFLNKMVLKKAENIYKFNKDKAILLFLPANESFSNKNYLRTSRERRNLLFFGRITKYKGLDLLFEACEHLNKLNIAYNLKVYGESREQIINNNENIEIHNRYIQESEIDNIFKSADILILPYIEASQSGVATLSASFGLPIVYTPTESLSEQLKDYGGICTTSFLSNDIANTIAKVLRNDELYNILSLKQIAVSKNLSWNNFVQILNNHLK